MNLPKSQSTNEKINSSLKSIYSNIASRYNQYAIYWNSIWNVWKGSSPTWGSTTGGNYLHQTIPVEYRYTNKKTYEGLTDEINPNIGGIESNIIETVGNQNSYKEKIRTFNNLLMNKFEEWEYTGAGNTLYTKPIKSYGVEYIVEGPNGIEEGYPKHFFVKDYETLSKDYTYGYVYNGNEKVYIYRDDSGNQIDENDIPKVNLYRDENVSTLDSTKIISLYSEGKHYYVKWTGERYYKTKNIDQYNRVVGESYTAPTNLTSNNSKGLTVYNSTIGGNTYLLFNGTTNCGVRTNISASNPEIITFNLTKSLKINNYTIQAETTYDTYPTSWMLQGSNDNSNWVTIDTRTGVKFTKGQSKPYTVNSNGYYLYHRLVITGFKTYSYKKRKMWRTTTVTVANIKKFTFSGLLSYTSINGGKIQPQNLGQSYSGDMTGIKTYSKSITNKIINNDNVEIGYVENIAPTKNRKAFDNNNNIIGYADKNDIVYNNNNIQIGIVKNNYQTFSKFEERCCPKCGSELKYNQSDKKYYCLNNRCPNYNKNVEAIQLGKLKVYDRNTAISLNNLEDNIRQDNLIRKEDYQQMQRVLDKINAVLKLRDGWFDKSGRCNLSCQVQCQHGCQVSCQHCNTHQCHNQKCGTH